MRLLHVQDLKVNEFNNDNTRPPYAILSHTWEDGEVSFQDIQNPTAAASKAGYTKILKCCEVANRDGFEYVWIDTCCIDKTSSAELSEAINSMFQWYRSASVCYAFLSDVENEYGHHDEWSQFRRSRWFDRGWTLQELLAPDIVVFYNRSWVDIGTKRSLQDVISDVTHIPRKALLDVKDMWETTSVATRMSWAAARRTTRVEDIAYSLMGIFNVNMPPLYGEGKMAFMRLQLEIIKNSQDESIFAWGGHLESSWEQHLHDSSRGCGMLGDSPAVFQNCKGMKWNVLCQHSPRPFSMSNIGLHAWLPAIRRRGVYNEDLLQIVLNCADSHGKYVSILLRLDDRSGQWTRYSDNVFLLDEAELKKIDDTMELYIAGGSHKPPVHTRYNRQSQVRYRFIESTSPETGYAIEYTSHGETVGTSARSDDQSHTWNFNNLERNKSAFHMNYLVVKSLAKPNIKATIALGVWKDLLTDTLTHHCRVFPGSAIHIPTDLSTFTSSSFSDSESEKNESMFFTIFHPDNRFRYFPSDKIINHLPSNDILAITVRTGPFERLHPLLYRHLHHVNIAFSQDARLLLCAKPNVEKLEQDGVFNRNKGVPPNVLPRLVPNKRFGRIFRSGTVWLRRILCGF